MLLDRVFGYRLMGGLLVLFLAVLGFGIAQGLDVECGCLSLGGPRGPGEQERAVFGTEIQELRQCAARFEPVRSLTEYPLEEDAA